MGSSKLFISGIVLGIVAGVLFSYPLGLNVVIYVLCVFITGVIFLASGKRRILTINSVFAIATLYFAVMMMVVTSTVLNTLNTMMLIGSLVLLTFFHDDTHFLGGSWGSVLATFYYVVSMEWLTSPFVLVRDVAYPLLDRANYRAESSFQAVIRGFALSIPVLLVAGGLLNSADLVVHHGVISVIDWIAVPHGTDILAAIVIGLVFFWMSIALFRVMDNGVDNRVDPTERLRRRKGFFRVRMGKLELSIQAISAWLKIQLRRLFHLSIIESTIILSSVVLLFVGYVIIQFPYFFGGTSNIGLEAFTYSSYARRGFFEAIAASGVSTLLILALDSITHQPSQRERQIFRGIATTLMIVTLPIIGSALMRLLLYEGVYGLTHARLVSLMLIACYPIILVLLLIRLFFQQGRIFQAGLLVLCFIFLGLFSLIRPDAFIAQRNIDHYRETGQLDSMYLLTLSDDAVPTLATFVDNLDSESPFYGQLVENLSNRLRDLDHDQTRREVFGYHYGKAQAWNALNQLRDILTQE